MGRRARDLWPIALLAVPAIGLGLWALTGNSIPKRRRMTIPELVILAWGAGWRGPALKTAVAVALAESGGDPTALNKNVHKDGHKSYDRGIWQINSTHDRKFPAEKAWIPEENARFAHRLWRERGGKFTDWTQFRNGEFERFVPVVDTTIKEMGINA